MDSATAAVASADAIERAVLARITPDAATRAKVDDARERLVRRAEEAARERSIPVVRCLVAGWSARASSWVARS
jgi:tRNA nucleotidyltransferase (CCA-adding enzyme)